ncbi:MAG: holo-ACP synthase [Eubacteriales bacterium]|nr:holo-ACP synthase [Christensenellaceae bacterium]MEA5065506.1 holo-ACP synthase [Eubacteriales bacterium]
MGGVLGLGLDLCAIGRIERALQNERFLHRAFSEGERGRIADRGAATAAGYFAAKEAVAKALGTGFDGFFLDSIEIEPDAPGCPQCILKGKALERMRELGGSRVLITITHDAGVAAAVAVIVS